MRRSSVAIAASGRCRSWRRFALAVVIGAGAAFIAIQPIFGFPFIFGFKDKLALGVASGMGLWAWACLRMQPMAIRHPSDVATQGRTYNVTIRIGFCLCVGLMLGLGLGLAPLKFVVSYAYSPCLAPSCASFAYSDISTFYIWFQATFGIAVGFLIAGLLDADSPWLRYFVATRLLAHRRKLPRRPAKFIDWAYAASLMRMAGIVVNFRHCEIQEALARTQKV